MPSRNPVDLALGRKIRLLRRRRIGRGETQTRVASYTVAEALPIPWDARRVLRRQIPHLSLGNKLEVIEWNGCWYEQPEGSALMVSVPDARPMTVKELVAERLRRTTRYGDWIEIDRETARVHPELTRWCRRYCNSELPSGTFRLSPKVWARQADDPMPIPYLPEFDHPSLSVRELATAERLRRGKELELEAATTIRDRRIRQASAEGHSRRELARVLGISFARVQQLARKRPPAD